MGCNPLVSILLRLTPFSWKNRRGVRHSSCCLFCSFLMWLYIYHRIFVCHRRFCTKNNQYFQNFDFASKNVTSFENYFFVCAATPLTFYTGYFSASFDGVVCSKLRRVSQEIEQYGCMSDQTNFTTQVIVDVTSCLWLVCYIFL